MATRHRYLNNPVIQIDGNPIDSYNPTFENHMIEDQVITNSNGYLAHIYKGVEYRQYVHKNANGDIVKVDPWIECDEVE